MTVRRPRITVTGPQGGDLIGRFGPKIAGVTITDQVGYDSDSCEIRIRQVPPYPALPAKGTKYTVKVWWSDQPGASYLGIFAYTGAALGGSAGDGYEMTLKLRAANLGDELLSVGSEHFDEKTLGDIITDVAKKAGYEAVVAPALKTVKIGYRLRSGQSRMDFISELAAEYGGAVKVAGDKIVVSKRGDGKSAGGSDLPIIRPKFGTADISHDFEIEDRGDYAECDVDYHDPQSGRRKRQKAKGNGKGRHRPAHPAASEDEAKAQAEAQRRERLRGTISGEFVMPGEPTAFAGAKVEPSGYGPDIDGAKITAEEVVHEINPDDGWQTTVSVEAATE